MKLLVPYYDAILTSREDISEKTAETIFSFLTTPCNATSNERHEGHEYLYYIEDSSTSLYNVTEGFRGHSVRQKVFMDIFSGSIYK